MRLRLFLLGLGCAAACSLAETSQALTLTGDSTTLARVVADQNLAEPGSHAQIPLNEFLSLNLYGLGIDGLSAQAAGWGRFDLLFENQDLADGNLTYGYLNWRSRDYGTHARAGRQYVAQGVAREQMDGLLVDTRLFGGLGASGFVGMPSVSFRGEGASGDSLWGGRAYWRGLDRYEVAASYVGSRENGDVDKQQVGAEGWAMPWDWLELSGEGSYDTISRNWFEVAGSATVRPIRELGLWVLYDRTIPGDFLSKASIFSVFSEDVVQDIGAGVDVKVLDGLNLLFDIRQTNYSGDGGRRIGAEELSATRFGGEVRWSYGQKDEGWLSASAGNVLGAAAYRTSGVEASTAATSDFTELRVYNLTNVTAALYASEDVVFYLYDTAIEGESNSIDLVGSLGYRFCPDLDVEGTLLYRTSPLFQDEVQGGLKVDYTFEAEIF